MRNNVEILGISNGVLDSEFEEKVIGICKESINDITSSDIGCYHLPLERNISKSKQEMVKFSWGSCNCKSHRKCPLPL